MSATAVQRAAWRGEGGLLFSPALTDLGVVAGSTTRPLGGMGGSGTPAEDAATARAAVAVHLGFSDVVRVKQMHGNEVVYAPFVRPAPASPAPGEPVSKVPEADAMWTDRAGVLLGVAVSDCVPVLVADAAARVGIAHAGWEGTTRSVARSLVRALRAAGADPAAMTAALGPSIGPCCYDITAARAGQIRDRLGAAAEVTVAEREGAFFFDLWTANEEQLREEGVGRIEISGICTKCGGRQTWSRRSGDIGLNGLAFIGRRA